MSLDSVSKALKDEDFKITSNLLITSGANKQEDFQMCRAKGIYPYDYIDSFERFNETELPPIEKFYSVLNQSNISKEEYERAQKMWKLFNCKNLGDYTDMYLRLDVYILADCFEKFRASQTRLEASNYVSLPSMSWDILMSSTKETLDLLTDVDMYNMIKNNIRGGISSVMGSRVINAYNKERLEKLYNIDEKCKDNFYILKPKDPNQEHDYQNILKSLTDPTHIRYYDATALYSGIMTQPMPYKDFKWIPIESNKTTPQGVKMLKDLLYTIAHATKDSEEG